MPSRKRHPARLRASTTRSTTLSTAATTKASENMSDEDITIALDIKCSEGSTSRRVGNASRKVHRLTGQWPWDWATDFLPAYWSVNMVERISMLVGLFQDSERSVGKAKAFLSGKIDDKAMSGKMNQHLKLGDIDLAVHHFRGQCGKPQASTRARVPKPRKKCMLESDTSEEEEGDGSHLSADLSDLDDDQKPQPSQLASKKRPTPSSLAPPAKRPRQSTGNLQPNGTTATSVLQQPTINGADGSSRGNTAESLSVTLAAMDKREASLRAVAETLETARNTLRDTIGDQETSQKQQQKSQALRDDIKALQLKIKELSAAKKETETRAERWEEMKHELGLSSEYIVRGFEEYRMQLKQNEDETAKAEIELQANTEALARHVESEQSPPQKESLAEVEENCQRAFKELQDWRTLVRFVRFYPSSMAILNTVLKMQETSMEALVDGSEDVSDA
ncbi:hypothetical protein F66182_2601 [Fusarium sp. NRRL 66182]|nr:hypothetical protein F66182_2601 [Fusarium sp. NRRL 66182]